MDRQKELLLSRRLLLKSMGGIALSVPLLRSLAQAQAASVTGPLPRLILICGESGGSSYWWRPQGGETDFNIEFEGAVLAPLASLRRKILVVNGVGNYVADFNGVENHEARAVTFTAWANSKPGDPNFARGPSVDRAIVNRLGETRPFYASIGDPQRSISSEYYYAAPGYPLNGVGTNLGIFSALFGGITPPPQPSQKQKALQDLESILLTQQLRDAQMYRSRLGADARIRLDEYLTTLQVKLDALKNAESPLGKIPPAPLSNPDYNKPMSIAGPYDHFSRDLDYVADALNLGITQVSCLRMNHGMVEDGFVGQTITTYDAKGRPVGSSRITDYHQQVAHTQGIGDQFRDLAPNLACRDVHRVHTKVIAGFLQKLDAAKEIDGSSVLDNSLVVWTTQLGDQASHRSGRLPYVLAGGLGEKKGTFRMGRFLDFAPGGISRFEDTLARQTAVASNLLLNSVQKTFGIEQDFFGEDVDSKKCRGYLPRAT